MTTKRTAARPPTTSQKNNLGRLFKHISCEALNELGLSSEDVCRLLSQGGALKTELKGQAQAMMLRYSTDRNIVTVPRLSAMKLTARTARGVRIGKTFLPLTYVSPDFANWNFYRNRYGQALRGRGLKFEPLVWTPRIKNGETLSTWNVYRHFQARGYFGHVGAFVEWLRTCGLSGFVATVPDELDCWRYNRDSEPEYPCAFFSGDRRDIFLNEVGTLYNDDSSSDCTFVAFRIVS